MPSIGAKCMDTTKDLIDAALQARSDYDSAVGGAGSAMASVKAAKDVLDAANQALHDDLKANGAYADVDVEAVPITVVLYTAQDPDSWNATPVRAA